LYILRLRHLRFVGKVGGIALKEAVLKLLDNKIPDLLYGLETCPLLKSDLSSLIRIIV